MTQMERLAPYFDLYDEVGSGVLTAKRCQRRPDDIRCELDQVDVLAVFLAEHVDLSQVGDLAYLQVLSARFRTFDEVKTDTSDE